MDRAEAALAGTAGVQTVSRVRVRWIGHGLHADTDLVIDAAVADPHELAHEAERLLVQAVPKRTGAVVHAYPVRGTPTSPADVKATSVDL